MAEKNMPANHDSIVKGNLVSALAKFKKKLDSNAGDLDAWFGLGGVNAKLGRYSEAERCYLNVTRLWPDSYAGHCYLGLTCLYQGRLYEALEALQYCVKIIPVYAQGYNYLGC